MSLIWILKGTCAALAVICALQAYSAFSEDDPLGGLEDMASVARPPAPTVTAQPQPPAAGAPPASPPPDRYAAIETSGILGAVPKGPPPPALLGLAGHYAIIRTPEGQVDLVAEGGTLGSVKVLKIGINRALIEHKGKLEELKIFDGLGGEPLLPEPAPK